MSVNFNPSFSTDEICVGQNLDLCLTDDLTSIKTSLEGKLSEDDAAATYSSVNHTHTGYAATDHTHSGYAAVDHTHSGYAASDHTHTIANVTGLQDALDGKAASSHTHTGYANASHTHSMSDVSGLAAALGDKADADHTHTVADISDLTATATELNYMDGVTSNVQTQLNSKAASGHTHSGYASSNHTHTPASIGAAASSHTHTVANISDLTATATELNYMDGVTSNVQTQLNGKAASSHNHTIANVTGLQDELDNKASSTHSHTIANVTGLQTALNGKASSDHTHTGFAVAGHSHTLDSLGAAASSHTHTVANISDLTATATELNYMDGVTSNVQTQLNGKAASSHTHSIANVTDLQNALNGKADYDHTHTDYAYSDHTHPYLPLSGGTVTGETNFSGGLVRLKGVQTLFHSGTQLVFGSNSLPTRLAGSAISATKTITVDSDERLKENIEPASIDECERFINGLNVKTFNYIGDDSPCIGVIAQEVNELDMADKFVVQGPDGYYSVKAADLVFPLIATVQKLAQEVEMLKNR